MLALLARTIGTVIILGFAYIGAQSVAWRVMDWKDSYDERLDSRNAIRRV